MNGDDKGKTLTIEDINAMSEAELDDKMLLFAKRQVLDVLANGLETVAGDEVVTIDPPAAYIQAAVRLSELAEKKKGDRRGRKNAVSEGLAEATKRRASSRNRQPEQ